MNTETNFSQAKPSDTPRTDALLVTFIETRTDAIMAFQTVTQLAKDLERELNEANKDYMCLAELLDGHDATECRMNLIQRLLLLTASNAALEACVEDSIELLGERGWWKDEPRAGFSQRYADTQENIERARNVLNQALRAGEAGVNSQTTNQTNP